MENIAAAKISQFFHLKSIRTRGRIDHLWALTNSCSASSPLCLRFAVNEDWGGHVERKWRGMTASAIPVYICSLRILLGGLILQSAGAGVLVVSRLDAAFFNWELPRKVRDEYLISFAERGQGGF